MLNPNKHYHLVSYLRLPLLLVAIASTVVFVYLLKADENSPKMDLPVREVSSHFIVKGENIGLAMQAAQEAEYALERINDEMFAAAPRFGDKVEIYLWNTDVQYRLAVPHVLEGSSGCSTYITLPDGRKLWRIDLLDYTPGSRVMSHEITHVMLSVFNEKAHKAGQKTIPLALHEGIAMMAEGVLHDDYMMLAAMGIAKDIESDEDILEKLLSVTQSDEIYSCSSEDDKADFYARSYSLAAFLRQNLKREGFKEFIAHLCSGASMDEAFAMASHLESDDLSSTRANIRDGWARHTLRNGIVASCVLSN